ncbi:serine hydrolase domain-containing protein [Lysinibacillus halotolerans]
MQLNVKERMEHYHVSGISYALIYNGQIRNVESYGLLEAGTNHYVNNDSIFSACSISKFLTAMLVLKLTDEGVFHLDEDVNEKLVSWKVPTNEFTKGKKVTLRNLLSHQSGIMDPENSFPELNANVGIPSMVELLEGKTSYCPKPIEVTYEPESEFHYSDAGYCVVQQLIEDVTGKSFQQIMEEFIWKPLNMENSTFSTFLRTDEGNCSCGHKNGEVVEGKYPIYPYPAASGLWTTSLDLAKLVVELMNALKGESTIGISANMAKEMITPQKGKAWAGLGVFLEGSNKEVEISSFGWGVGFQCMMVAYPYLGSGLVIMTNTDLGVHQLEGFIGEVYHHFKSEKNEE